MEENTKLIFHFNIGTELSKSLLDSPLFGTFYVIITNAKFNKTNGLASSS